MRLRLATKFSAIIVGIFALSLLSNAMALFVAWRVGKRMDEIARTDVPSASAAEEFRAALLEEKAVHATYLLQGGRKEWIDGLERAESHFRNAIYMMRGAADHADGEDANLLNRLEATYRELETRQQEAVALDARGNKEEAKQRVLATLNGPLFREADAVCVQMAAAADERVEENSARAARRVHQTAWVVGISGGLTLGLGGALLWLFFRRIVIPLRGLVGDIQLLHGASFPSDDRSEEDELRMVGDCFRGLMSDVTDTRSSLERSHSRLLVAEKLASVGKLAASVAHEIRNPLTAMKMWLFSIRESVRGNPELDHKLGIIAEETTRLDHIIRDFLEFSRPPALHRQAQAVEQILQQTLELLAATLREKSISVVKGPMAGLPAIMADPDQLKQVLINVLNNAAEAMGKGGEIRIAAAAERDAEGHAMLVVRICDSGPGMAIDIQRRVFEPFFSTKESGTGLGLCIAARIMAAHNGLLVLESSSEKGTTFAIWTPVAEADTHG